MPPAEWSGRDWLENREAVGAQSWGAGGAQPEDQGRTQWSGWSPGQLQSSSQVSGRDMEMSELCYGFLSPARHSRADGWDPVAVTSES